MTISIDDLEATLTERFAAVAAEMRKINPTAVELIESLHVLKAHVAKSGNLEIRSKLRDDGSVVITTDLSTAEPGVPLRIVVRKDGSNINVLHSGEPLEISGKTPHEHVLMAFADIAGELMRQGQAPVPRVQAQYQGRPDGCPP